GDEFEFAADLHDTADKKFLGRSGPWNGEDIVRTILEQPAAALFVVRKLYRFLISENESPPDALLEPLAQVFRKSDYDIGLLVRTMLSSRLFFSEHAYRQRVKSPVEFVVGIAHTFEGGRPSRATMAPELAAMGQLLFARPNVKGCCGGNAWVTTATTVARPR